MSRFAHSSQTQHGADASGQGISVNFLTWLRKAKELSNSGCQKETEATLSCYPPHRNGTRRWLCFLLIYNTMNIPTLLWTELCASPVTLSCSLAERWAAEIGHVGLFHNQLEHEGRAHCRGRHRLLTTQQSSSSAKQFLSSALSLGKTTTHSIHADCQDLKADHQN